MTYLILLGGNEGCVRDAFAQAEAMLTACAKFVRRSSIYVSPPWGYESARPYLNQVLECESTMAPHDFLRLTQHVERALGRRHKTTDDGRYADRPVDIDILFADDMTISTAELTVPHPRLHLRRFTLMPLAECWADWPHPILGKSAAQMLSGCNDASVVMRMA